MLMKCCNPECEAPFDYREGRLIRFSSRQSDGNCEGGRYLIQHFWLCGRCASQFVFEHESGISVRIKPRHEELSTSNLSHFVPAA
jgi:hypothetical protein